jgi:glycine dehydrogenase subunit 1
MGSYMPATEEERREMLDAVGAGSAEALFADVPPEARLGRKLNLPEGMAELELRRTMEDIAGKNRVYPTVLRGAGAYRHYIPAALKESAAKEEFVTAYTPYQPELNQGILQAMFEYQTMICALTGMDVSNSSVYDGAPAAAEAAAMCREKNRTAVLVSETAHPDVIATMRTYCYGAGVKLLPVPAKDGRTDADALRALVSDGSASCFLLQQPNFFGIFEDAEALGDIIHGAGGKFILSCNPIALAIMKTPAESGADIAVGEGQPLGLPLSFGGPFLGFMAAKKTLFRRLPGRIVGETADHEGRRAFVLTLQAREQHIRREKASSNICSNEAHCALTAAIYMSVMGPAGMEEAARQSLSRAHYLADRLCEIPGVSLRYEGAFFHEFLTRVPVPAEKILSALEEKGILGGLPLEDGILWCATELVARAQLDEAAAVVREACGL